MGIDRKGVKWAKEMKDIERKIEYAIDIYFDSYRINDAT